MMGDVKLARNGTLDGKEHEEVSRSEQEEVVTRHHKESSCALTVQLTNM